MNANFPKRQLAVRMLLLASMSLLIGCQGAGFIAHALKDDSIKPVYVLQPRPTVILVDDPNNQLGADQVSVDVATTIGEHLVEHEALKSIISQTKVNDLRHGLGKKFASQHVDVIGRDVGAQQVIHVHIRSVNYMAQPGMIQPKATVLVKVIDVASRKRLFPPPNAEELNSPLPIFKGGYVLTAAMRERVMDGIGSDQQMKVFQARLAEYTAASVAKLFYKHQPENRMQGDN